MTDADTWVNLKGNNYLVQGNRGTSASDNGFETHDILPGWGDFNVFDDNTASWADPATASPRGPRAPTSCSAPTPSPTPPRASATSRAPDGTGPHLRHSPPPQGGTP